MSLYYLTSADFFVNNGHLVNNAPGMTFVMFHMQGCGHCINFMPAFKNLPNMIRGVNFALCNIDDNAREVVQKATSSSTPIKGVPKFILYNNGMPAAEYHGPRNPQAVLGFIQEMMGQMNQKQDFVQPRSRQVPQAQMPAASGGFAPPPQQQQAQPTRPQQSQQPKPYTTNPNTGVKEYETSYGRPYNTMNEQEFLAYESAYKS